MYQWPMANVSQPINNVGGIGVAVQRRNPSNESVAWPAGHPIISSVMKILSNNLNR